MIQLATDPAASRHHDRLSQEVEGKAHAFSAQRGRSGHAWPFLSRTPERPTVPEGEKPIYGNNGS